MSSPSYLTPSITPTPGRPGTSTAPAVGRRGGPSWGRCAAPAPTKWGVVPSHSTPPYSAPARARRRGVVATLLTLTTVGLWLLATPSVRAATLTTFATFNAATFEAPENIVIDRDNNVFVSLLLSNEVRKITPAGVQSTYATLPGGPGLTAGLVIDDDTGDLYVAYSPFGPQPSVVYVVHPDRSQHVIATFPVGAGLNGMTPDADGNLYLADSFLGVVWRVPAGGGTPSILIDLHAPGSLQLPGPNGIKFDKYQRQLYV